VKKSTKIPTDPAKLAVYRKVEVMKMRHKAIALDPKDKSASPSLDQRVHIKVQYDEQSKAFWVRKVRSTYDVSFDFTWAQVGSY
jgi:rRNA processing protein Krr1/Pno1